MMLYKYPPPPSRQVHTYMHNTYIHTYIHGTHMQPTLAVKPISSSSPAHRSGAPIFRFFFSIFPFFFFFLFCCVYVRKTL